MTPAAEIAALRKKEWWTTVEVRRVYDVASGKLYWWQARQKNALAARERKDTQNENRTFWEYPQHAIHAFCKQYGVKLTDFGEAVMKQELAAKAPPVTYAEVMVAQGVDAIVDGQLLTIKGAAELPPVQQGQVEQYAKLYGGDQEIGAMHVAYHALRELTEPQKDRALKWLCERLDAELARS